MLHPVIQSHSTALIVGKGPELYLQLGAFQDHFREKRLTENFFNMHADIYKNSRICRVRVC